MRGSPHHAQGLHDSLAAGEICSAHGKDTFMVPSAAAQGVRPARRARRVLPAASPARKTLHAVHVREDVVVHATTWMRAPHRAGARIATAGEARALAARFGRMSTTMIIVSSCHDGLRTRGVRPGCASSRPYLATTSRDSDEHYAKPSLATTHISSSSTSPSAPPGLGAFHPAAAIRWRPAAVRSSGIHVVAMSDD